MKNKEIIEKTCEEAFKNGFTKYGKFDCVVSFGDYFITKFHKKVFVCVEELIFNKDFAKAIFGRREKCGTIKKGIKQWKYYLKEIVLEKEPLKYLENFL